MKFANPQHDIVFKKVFGDQNKKNILISFLNAVLDLNGLQKICDVTFLNPSQPPSIRILKDTTFLDIRVTDQNQKEFIIEMQVEQRDLFIKRALYYTAKAYTQQLKKKELYSTLNPVIFIGILNFNLFSEKAYLSQHQIVHHESKEQSLKDFEFYFIELRKFKKKEQEIQGVIDQWIYFLKHADHLTMIPSILSDEVQEAYEISDMHTWTKEQIRVYEYWDLEDLLEDKIKSDREEKGRREGREEGRKEGEEKGRREGREEVFQILVDSGMPPEEAKKRLKIK